MKNDQYDFREIADHRGSLVAIEAMKDVPFEIKRVYYIYDTPANERRGYHAHKQLQQILICLNGSCKVLLDDGESKRIEALDSLSQGLFVDKMVWREMYDFSPGSILLVLASEHYDERDYIRDYEDFLKEVKK